jgi:ethanolamine ammonia-lyase small subunit
VTEDEVVIDLPDAAGPGLPRPVGIEHPTDADMLRQMLGATAARIGVGRAGPRYRTGALLRFQADHAIARDTLTRDVAAMLIEEWGLFPVQTAITGGRHEYLLAPHLGRRLTGASRRLIRERCRPAPQLQIVVGDGLSAEAVEANAGLLLSALTGRAAEAGLTVGTPFFVRHARVGVMNDIGNLLGPEVLVLLIGERPGLGRADALSAYLGYRPRTGHTDADRDVISGIAPSGGLTPELAAGQIIDLAQRMTTHQASGVRLKLAAGNR